MNKTAEHALNVCPCCKDPDGKWRFVCTCGFQAETVSTATGCPRCGIPWRFEQEVKAA